MAVVAAAPAVSATESSAIATVSTSGTSSSVTSSESVPLASPLAAAVIVTVCVPSTSLSSSAVMSNVALFWPSRMVTVAGTVTSVVSLLVRLTDRSPEVEPVRVTVAVVAAAPAVSATELSAIESVSRPPPLSGRIASPPRLRSLVPEVGVTAISISPDASAMIVSANEESDLPLSPCSLLTYKLPAVSV